MSYPAKYQPLLAGAGLIRTGKMTLMGYVSEEKRNKLEESSNTWSKGEEPLIDTTDVPIRISVVRDGNGGVLDDWAKGLTKEQVEAINKECGVPLITPVNDEEWPKTYASGDSFDLSDPTQCAMFRIAATNDHIAKDKQSFDGGHVAYWYNAVDELSVKLSNRKIKHEASSYVSTLKLSEKKDILKVLNFEQMWSMPERSDIEAEMDFMDYAETHAENLVKIRNYKDLISRVVVIRCIETGGVMIDQGRVCYADGVQIAQSFEDLMGMISKDRKLLEQMNQASDNFRTTAVASVAKGNSDFIDSISVAVDFDVTIHATEDVKLWPAEACKKYLSQGVVPKGIDLMTIEELQKEVLIVHSAKFVD